MEESLYPTFFPGVAYSLRSAIGETSRASDAQYIGKASCPAKEASIVKSISVDPSRETLGSAQCKLHSVFVTCLAH